MSMEERVPPATFNDHDHDHHQYDTSSNKKDEEDEFDACYNLKDEDNVTRKLDKDDEDETQMIPSSKADCKEDDSGSNNNQPHATYIIQIPKDQIYRVPPPENAEIAERYRNPAQNTRNGRRRCMYWSLSIFFVVAFLVSLIVCVHHFTLKPKNPTFSIKHLVVKPLSTHSKKNNSPGFQVSLETRNPNNVNDIGYQQGSATLAYKGKEIGHGSFPGIQNEESGKSDAVDVILKGSLPKELASQPHKHNKHKPLDFNLTLSIPLKMKTWLFTKKVHVEVGCHFEVNSVGENIKVLSQKCDIRS